MASKLIFSVALTIATSGALAQSKFDGTYGQIGIGYEGISPSVSSNDVQYSGNGGVSVPVSLSANNSNSFTGVITAGYMASVNQSFLLGMGAEYSPIKGRNTNYSVNLSGSPLLSGSYNKEYYYNIFISPAAPIGSDGLIYGKFGYTGMLIKDSIAGSSTNTNFSGFSLGAGYKQIIDGSLYGFVEGNYLFYGNHTFSDSSTVSGNTVTTSFTARADTYNLLLGIGYKF